MASRNDMIRIGQMRFRLRSLLTRDNWDRLFAYGSFVVLWGGWLAILALVTVDGTAQWYMVAWGCVMVALVLAGMRLTKRSN